MSPAKAPGPSSTGWAVEGAGTRAGGDTSFWPICEVSEQLAAGNGS